MQFIDTHCHFDAPDFDDDRQTILQQTLELGITDLILPAIHAQSWSNLRQMCQQSPHLHASYGLHPVYLKKHQSADLTALRAQLMLGDAVAIGECGLDFFLPELNQHDQEILFVAHLQLAQEFALPLIIHARRALDTVLKHLRRFSGLRGVVHSFAGSQQQADMLIKQGFYLGVGGTCTYPRAQRLRSVISHVPLERLLLETDAPDQPDSQWQGQRNYPLRLPFIAATLATLRGDNIASIAAATTANAITLFNLNKPQP